jgi:hypothetical protein
MEIMHIEHKLTVRSHPQAASDRLFFRSNARSNTGLSQ